MLPPESAFCSNHDRKRTFLGCVHAYFAKAFWNADSKRRSKNAVHGSTVHASLEKKTIYRRRHVLSATLLGMFNPALLFERQAWYPVTLEAVYMSPNAVGMKIRCTFLDIAFSAF